MGKEEEWSEKKTAKSRKNTLQVRKTNKGRKQGKKKAPQREGKKGSCPAKLTISSLARKKKQRPRVRPQPKMGGIERRISRPRRGKGSKKTKGEIVRQNEQMKLIKEKGDKERRPSSKCEIKSREKKGDSNEKVQGLVPRVAKKKI